MFSFLPCIFVLTLLSCANISVKYSGLETQNSHCRYFKKQSCFSSLKNVCSSFWSLCMRRSTLPFESHLTFVWKSKRLFLRIHINHFNNLV
uniref:Secreted protein n=1 Tax=Octopus bimaculoides TaxID=37653 RepID=A0A0L8HAW8_OCTBM